MLLVCWWLLVDPSKNIQKMQHFIGFENGKCCSLRVAGNHCYLKKTCKMAANRLKPPEYLILVKIIVCTRNLAT